MDIYVQKDGQRQGPFPEARIRQGIDAGEFDPADLAWTKGKASWQPLSVLINLDLDEPPPILPIHAGRPNAPVPTAAVALPLFPTLPPIPSTWPPTPPPLRASGTTPQTQTRLPLFTEPERVAPPLPSLQPATEQPSSDSAKFPPIQVASAAGNKCKRCGSPYNWFSPQRAIGAGLCVACTKVDAKLRPKPIAQRELKTREDALKVVRFAGIFYLAMILLDVCIGLMSDPDFLISAVVLLICTLGIWLAHSRIAAVVLITYIIAGVTINLMQGNGVGILPLTLFQFGVTFKACEAVFKLNKELVPPLHRSRSSAI